MDLIRTGKWDIYGAGFGLIVSAVLLVLATLSFRLWRPGSFRRISTPRSKWAYLLLTAAVWISFTVTVVFDLAADHTRGQVHPLNDAAERSLSFFLMMLLVLCAISLLVKAITLWKVKLPVGLWAWDAHRTRPSLIWTIIYGLWGAVLLLTAVSMAFAGDWSAIPVGFGVYLALCGRAVRAAPRLSAADS